MPNALHIQNIVVKLGTSTVTQGGHRRLSRNSMMEIAKQIAKIHENGQNVIIVTCGAIAAGKEILDNPHREKFLPNKQVLAAIGQIRLMHTWSKLFELFDLQVGQILITRSDLTNPQKYLNIRDSLYHLMSQGIVPIINENDPVVTKEIRFGDNDSLSALVANMVGSHLLVLLTDQKGLYTDDPNRNPKAELIPVVEHIDKKIIDSVGGAPLGIGGIQNKIKAALLATQNGIPTVIASSSVPDILLHLANGQREGTLFLAETTPRESRKRWLLSEKPHGTLHIDTHAEQILRKQASGLFTNGIISSSHTFERGSIVQLISQIGQPIGVGLINYSSKDLQKIIAQQSRKIEDCLGYTFGEEIIHKDHIALLASK